MQVETDAIVVQIRPPATPRRGRMGLNNRICVATRLLPAGAKTAALGGWQRRGRPGQTPIFALKIPLSCSRVCKIDATIPGFSWILGRPSVNQVSKLANCDDGFWKDSTVSTSDGVEASLRQVSRRAMQESLQPSMGLELLLGAFVSWSAVVIRTGLFHYGLHPVADKRNMRSTVAKEKGPAKRTAQLHAHFPDHQWTGVTAGRCWSADLSGATKYGRGGPRSAGLQARNERLSSQYGENCASRRWRRPDNGPRIS
jgi:hypothetical protein